MQTFRPLTVDLVFRLREVYERKNKHTQMLRARPREWCAHAENGIVSDMFFVSNTRKSTQKYGMVYCAHSTSGCVSIKCYIWEMLVYTFTETEMGWVEGGCFINRIHIWTNTALVFGSPFVAMVWVATATSSRCCKSAKVKCLRTASRLSNARERHENLHDETHTYTV